MVESNMNPYLTMIVMLLVGIIIGAWQGFWIAYVRIPPFIVTLAGMFAFRGLSNVVLEGQTLAPMPDSYLASFNNYVPDPFGTETFNVTCFAVGVIDCVLVGLCDSCNERPCRCYFYAVGGNEKATKLSGINTNRVYFLAYLNMGLLSAVAGMITMARMNSANPQAGTNFEMDAIGACFIGGASAYGGTGTVPGVIIGALLMGVLNLGMSIMGIDQNLQKVVKGLVLLAAVIFDVVSKRKSFIVK